MAVAGAVIVPTDQSALSLLTSRLGTISEIEVYESGEGGIAILIKSKDLKRLKELSALIGSWKEVADLQFAWLE